MSELILSGLRASEPIGFLAALGILRVANARTGLGVVRLGWSEFSGWPARLTSDKDLAADGLIAELVDHMRGRHQLPMFSGLTDADDPESSEPWDDVKVPTDEFAERLRRFRGCASQGERESPDLFAALGSELATISNKDVVKPSALHMTSGQQTFLSILRELAASLDPGSPVPKWASCPPAEAFREAVFAEPNGWQSADKFSSVGFDPNREAVYALSASAPTDVGARCTRAAIWLAAEAIPFFPCVPKGRRLLTRGFDSRNTKFTWPVWDNELSADAAKTILGIGLTGEKLRKAKQFGIRAVMQSERVNIGQGYGQFRPATRVPQLT